MDAVTTIAKSSNEYGVAVVVMSVLLVALLFIGWKLVTFFMAQSTTIQAKLMEIISESGKIAQRSTDALENNSKALWEVASALKACPGQKLNQQRENQ